MTSSLFTQIMRYAEQRIPTLNEYCVVCDERHVFQNGPMLKVQIAGCRLSEPKLQTQRAADILSLFCLYVFPAGSLHQRVVCVLLLYTGGDVWSYR